MEAEGRKYQILLAEELEDMVLKLVLNQNGRGSSSGGAVSLLGKIFSPYKPRSPQDEHNKFFFQHNSHRRTRTNDP